MGESLTSNRPWIPPRSFLWGFVSQGASSVTNFGLSLLAGIVLGPKGLGTIFIGFTGYLLVLGFQRALITDPLVSTSSSSPVAERLAASRAGLTASLLWAGGAVAAFASIGLALGGDLGQGLLLFAPWVAPSLVQDFWRVVLFRDGRGHAGALNDLLWMLTMGLAALVVVVHPSEWTVVGCWGAGAAVSMLVGFRQTLLIPSPLPATLRWWKTRGWPLGRWLAAESTVYAVGAQGLVFLLVPIVGAGALGGLRAVQTLFAPLSLLGPALNLPAFPHLSRTVRRSVPSARSFARRLNASAALLTGLYVLAASAAGSLVLGAIFGASFERFTPLIWPVGVGEVMLAGTLGFSLLMKAQGRGRAILTCRTVGSVSALTFTIVLALASGIEGAAWGMALGAVVGALAVLVASRGRGAGSGTGAPMLPSTKRSRHERDQLDAQVGPAR
jgi:O-antigen/teichoic acid export membrane protein